MSDTNPQYTQNVNSLISGLKVKDSLDFTNQQAKALVKYVPESNFRYEPSQRMTDIKQQYKTKNTLPQIHELETEASNMKKNIVDAKKEELMNLRDDTIEKLPYFQEIQDIQDLVDSNPDMKDEMAEASLEALVSFNDDMKLLAVNAFQMQELTNYVMEENDLMLEWMSKMEAETFKVEDGIQKIGQSLQQTILGTEPGENAGKRTK